ncbi:MAG: MFS transporter [Desulfobacterales bacterium]|nr:MFS transporter [Desulfobacterales bacterium]
MEGMNRRAVAPSTGFHEPAPRQSPERPPIPASGFSLPRCRSSSGSPCSTVPPSPSLTTDLMRDVPMDMGALGLVSAAFFYTYALFQIPGGLLLDRFSPAKVMAAFYLLGPRRGDPLFAVADSPGVMVLGRLLTGAGMACGFIGALKIISLQFPPDRFATLSGVVVSVGNMGIVVATTPLVLWAQGLGWRTTFLLVGLFHLAVTLTFVFAFRDRRGQRSGAYRLQAGADWKAQLGGLRLALEDRQVWLISWSAFIRYGILAAVQGLWAGPYLMDVMGYSPVTAGNLLFLLTLGVVIGNPVSGFLSDRILKKKGDHGLSPWRGFPSRWPVLPSSPSVRRSGSWRPFFGLRHSRRHREHSLRPPQGAHSAGALGHRPDGPEFFRHCRGRRLHAGAGPS